MAKVEVRGDELLVSLSKVESILAAHGSFAVRVADVIGVTVDPGVGSESKGLRAPGTCVPGLLTLGTYFHQGARTFWCIRRGSKAVSISLTGSAFDRLVIDVADPYGVAESINRARIPR